MFASLPVGVQTAKSNNLAKYVELTVDSLRTGVRFPPPPPILKGSDISGPFFLPEIPALRGVPATCAVGGHQPKCPESATFAARAVSVLCLVCG